VIVDSVEVGRSAVNSRYNSGPRTLPWGTPALTEESFVYSRFRFHEKVSVMQMGFEQNEIIQREKKS
jgi:hypothetical protein